MSEPRDTEAQKVLALAAEEALAVGHGWVGTEHLLLGLLRSVGEASAGSTELRQILAHPGLDRVRGTVLEIVPPEPKAARGEGAVLTPRTERVLGHSSKVAAAVGAGSVSADHLLLGLLWEVEGIGARILAEYDLSYGAAAEALSVPVSDLPKTPYEASFGPEIDVSLEELEVLLRELPDVIPPECPMAFNVGEDGRAWVVLGEEVVAEACVRKALARS